MSEQRIALVFSGDFPEGNTKNARLKSLANELFEKQWSVDFVSVYPTRFSKSPGFKQLKKWKKFPIKRMAVGATYVANKPLRVLQLLSGVIRTFFYFVFNGGRYKVIYFYNPRFTDSLIAMLGCSFMGRKVIVDQTELYSTDKNRRIHLWEERIIGKRASAIFTISDRINDRFINLSSKAKLFKLPIMVDIQRFNKLRKEVPNLIGYIGSFAHKDGVEDLVKGFLKAQTTLPKLRLRLIGHNPNKADLEDFIARHGASDLIEITGTVTYEEVPWLLKECDTLVMNRKNTLFASTGYPIKLGEYFACKRTVIMSDIQGFSEDFEHGNQAYLYKADSPDAIAEILIYRYNNIAESDAIAQRGFDYAKDNFSSKRNALYFVNALKEL